MFHDRKDAGRQLAERLKGYRISHPLVLGLPRGGIPVAYEVAVALHAPLDVIVSRKIGAPMQPELAIGAIAPGGILFLDRAAIRYLGLEDGLLNQIIMKEQLEVERRNRRYRGSDGLPSVKDRTVILVDDGIATGLTMLAAIKALRQAELRRIILAVPVSSFQAAQMLREEVEDFVSLTIPEQMIAVGSWYIHFEPVSDEEVASLLQRATAQSTDIFDEEA